MFFLGPQRTWIYVLLCSILQSRGKETGCQQKRTLRPHRQQKRGSERENQPLGKTNSRPALQSEPEDERKPRHRKRRVCRENRQTTFQGAERAGAAARKMCEGFAIRDGLMEARKPEHTQRTLQQSLSQPTPLEIQVRGFAVRDQQQSQ